MAGSAYTEPIAVIDTFTTGIARIEEIGGNIRFTFYADQKSLYSGERERVIVSRLIIPIPNLIIMHEATTIALHGVNGVVGDTVIEARH
ncbi:MAG: hypothetical protein WC100_18870 [Sterolibacterium sp.]